MLVASCEKLALQLLHVAPCDVPDDILVNVYYVPPRRVLKEAIGVEVLPFIPTPDVKSCDVIPDVVLNLVRGSRLVLAEPVRVFRAPHANRTLRGSDVKGIGDESVLRDKPMYINGGINVVEESSKRVKVVGDARAEPGGPVYRVTGWISKEDAVT